MLPTREEAIALVKDGLQSNPGPWGKHCLTAAHCAEKIASACGDMDSEKAYILGLLHDIGRKYGVRHLGHVSDGFSYMTRLGYDEVAKVCLTHSFNNHTVDEYNIALCLVGPQGGGKSTFFRLLAMNDEWFSDDLRRFDDENAYRKIQGHWFIELSEMGAITRAKSIEETKSFISRQKETYKVPYETYPEDRPIRIGKSIYIPLIDIKFNVLGRCQFYIRKRRHMVFLFEGPIKI